MAPLVYALGWTLLHFCWQGAVVALLLFCVLGAIGTRSSRLRYTAACAALGVMVALPLITFVCLAAESRQALAIASMPVHIVIVAANVATNDPAFSRAHLAVVLDRAMPWLLAMWLAGVSCLFIRLGLGLFAARGLRLSGAPVSEELQILVNQLGRRFGISRAVRLLHSTRLEVPAVIGWLRPVVLLPASCLSGLTPEQIEAILCHELAHIRRHDYLVSVLQSVVETLFFYHPAVWWISGQIRRERECCCDEFAVRAGADVLTYARALAQLEEQRPNIPQLALAANGGVLKMRIQRLLGGPGSPNASQPAFITVLGIALLLTLSFASHHVWAEVNAEKPVPAKTLAQASAVALPSTSRVATTGDQSPVSTASSASTSQPASESWHESQEQLARPSKMREQQAQAVAATYAEFLGRMQDAAKDRNAMLAASAQQVPAAQDTPSASVSAGVMEGQLITHVNPVYPQIAKTAHVEGTVVLRAVISKEGKVENLQAISGSPMLVQSALEAVQQWTYRPYLLNGQPIEVQTTIHVNYSLAPDLSCSYYDKKNQVHDGTCEVGVTDKGHYYCRADDDKTQVQPQSSCEDKVKGMQQGSLSPEQFDISGAHAQAASAAFQPRRSSAGDIRSTLNTENGTASSMPSSDAAGNPVLRIADGVLPPTLIHQAAPEYSAEAKAAKYSGKVIVSCIVNQQGQPEDVRVVRGVGMGLDEKAREAVKQYTFKPATQNGSPVSVALNVEVDFKYF